MTVPFQGRSRAFWAGVGGTCTLLTRLAWKIGCGQPFGSNDRRLTTDAMALEFTSHYLAKNPDHEHR